MHIHPEYSRNRRKIFIIGFLSISIGVLGSVIPMLPGTIFVFVGFSVLSLQSSKAHRLIAMARARHPKICKKMEAFETRAVNFFDLTTHSRAYSMIPARDNTTISVLVETSDLRTGVAILLHSASGVRDSGVMETLAESLRARGLTLVRFDARNGLGESTGEFTQFNTTNYREDLETVLAWAREQSWWQETLVLSGHSLGGLVAGLYATKHVHDVHELLLLAPTLSGDSYLAALEKSEPDTLAEWQKTKTKSLYHPLSKDKYGLPYSFVEDMRQYDLLQDAHKLTMPVHVLSGTKDTTAPLSDCHSFTNAVGKQATLTTLNNVPHTPKDHAELTTLKKVLVKLS